MQSGYYSATGGMVTQFNRMDHIANNLANTNTNGFKRDDVVIGDFMRLYKEQRDILPLENHTKDAAKFVNRSIDRVPHIVEQYSENKLGGFKKTSNPLDFALSKKDTYFAIETPEGVRYTRDGSFSMNAQGRLVTKEGYPVLPREYFQNGQYIDLPQNMSISADRDGNIYVDEGDVEVNGELFSNLAVVEFENPKYLKKSGDNLYEALREEERLVMQNSGAVRQGFVEKSNVNPIKEMTSLIETNRLVDMYQKVMKSHMDDLNSDAINKLATTRA